MQYGQSRQDSCTTSARKKLSLIYRPRMLVLKDALVQVSAILVLSDQTALILPERPAAFVNKGFFVEMA
jgi:hypothetical protein